MKKFFAMMLAVLCAVTAMTACNKKSSEKKATADEKKAQSAAEEAAEIPTISITPADETYNAGFEQLLIGKWVSYSSDGCPISYTFGDDGSVSYSKDGKETGAYSYDFTDGILTINSDKKAFSYLCSENAVTLTADTNHGQLLQFYSDKGEEIEGFNGCVYVADDFLYLGVICLCREDALAGHDETTLDGKWVGVSGDYIIFSSDGTYTYRDEGISYNGEYDPDYDIKTLNIKIGDSSTNYNDESWGIDGRVMHIKNQYYFKSNE